MNMQILTFVCLCATFACVQSHPVEVGDAVVEIEKQRLVKFPDDVDQEQRDTGPTTSRPNKQDEAKRILQEIEKINHALGYVRKQPEQPKLPPILDSSQYLFPKPAVQPFHQQHHQVAGLHGETILIPSIRAIRIGAQNTDATFEYNAPPKRKTVAATHSKSAGKSDSIDYYFRPNQVQLPAPQSAYEQQQLPTHFVIPVRLYKLNKEEYIRKHAPQEYRVKGYKIVGDIDNFYGKAKEQQQQQQQHKNKPHHKQKSTPKYHLFFLPREVVLNEDSTLKRPQMTASTQSHAQRVEPKEQAEEQQLSMPAQDTNSREEKLANRPFKLQTTTTTNSNGNTVTNTTTQVVRKRIVPKPPQQQNNRVGVYQAQLPNVGAVDATSGAHISTPAHVVNTLSGSEQQNAHLNGNTGGSGSGTGAATGAGVGPGVNAGTGAAATSSNSGFNLFNLRPGNLAGNNNNNNNNYILGSMSNGMQNNTAATSNVIKNAFQNIFKFPFRQDAKPETSTAAPAQQYEPQQAPPKTFFNGQLMQSLTQSQPVLFTSSNVPSHQTHKDHVQEHDYRWEDETSDSATEDDSDSDSGSTEQVEKKIFGQHQNFLANAVGVATQDTQREAIKEGGIIIQRLKVRKGGIAIAGPGGVATAGSGGTAIVGPGGYALTHPRSLTIAGPGAKVIAIPAHVDLKDALQRTNLNAQSFPREGKIVATGPTVYFAPATGTGTSIEE